MERYPLPAGHRVGPLDVLFDDQTVKLLARHEERDPEEFWTAVEAPVGHLVTTTWSSTGALVEISAAGVTKASTLALLCDELGVTADEVVAFGDMPNDLAMLAWAGTSYAMANAHPSVLALADRRRAVQRGRRRRRRARGAVRPRLSGFEALALRARAPQPTKGGFFSRCTTPNISSAATPVTASMTAPIGAAVVLPKAPTSGATTAPMPNCTQPSTAAAVPAASPCRVSASAGVFGSASPAVDTSRPSGTSTATRPPAAGQPDEQQRGRRGHRQDDGAAEHLPHA